MEEKFISDWEEIKLDPKIKNEIDAVRNNINQTSVEFHNYIYPKYINNYKKYLWYVADRLSSIEPWQSNINYPMISSAIDIMFSNIFDFWYEIWISDEWLKSACTKAFDFRNIWKNVLKEIIKESLILWKAYAKDYFIKETFEENFFDQKIKYDIKMPSMQYISAFDIMYDRSKWIERSEYKIIRTFMSWDNIKNKILPLLTIDKTNEEIKLIKNKIDELLKKYHLSYWSRFSNYDYNPVKSLTEATLWFNSDNRNDYYNLNYCKSSEDLKWGFVVDKWLNEENKNYFLNTNKSTYEVVEYYTSEKKYIFVNWFLMYFGKPKYNLWIIREVSFSSIPWTGNAQWIADKLTWHQDLHNTLWNAYIDNLKLLLWPMFKITGNIPMSKNWSISFKWFRAFKTNGGNNIETVQLWNPSFAPIQFMQMNERAATEVTSITNYIWWWTGAIERVQWWIDLKWNQYKARLTPLIDSIDQLMWNIIRSWIIMFLKFFTKDELLKRNIEVIEIFDTDNKWRSKFKTFEINWIDIKDILDESNISFTYNSLDKSTKENSRDTLIRNFQFMIQYIPEAINMEEMWKVFAWRDFNPLKVFKKVDISSKWLQQQYQPQYQSQLQEQQYIWQDLSQEELSQQDLSQQELDKEELLKQLQNIV